MKKALLKILPVILVALLIISLATAFKYTPGVKPHTRYNPLRVGCYYYYGYGSCEVKSAECRGVNIGVDKWVDLGDACNRNVAPTIINVEDFSATEGDTIMIKAECHDEDPNTISYSGWMNQAEKKTGYNDAGKHKVTITCTDSFNKTVSADLTITIKDLNRAPLFKGIGIESQR